MKAFVAMIKTESKLTIRCMDSILFGVLFPIGMVLILGMIYGNKPAFKGADYTFMQQSFGAVISIGICATGLMGIPLSVSNYRHMKILKRFQVTPISPGLVLLTQVIVQLSIALVATLGVYLVAKLFFGYKMIGSVGGFLFAFLLVVLAMYGIGMMIASVAPNIKVANLLCTVAYFPMIFLSGATVPYEVLPKSMQRITDILPLTQGIKLLKNFSLGNSPDSMILAIVVLVGIAVITILVSIKTFKWE